MPRREIVDYIKQETKRGVHIDRIKEKLYTYGHSEKNIDDALNHFKKKKNITNYAILFVSVAVFLVVVILSYSIFTTQTASTDLISSRPETKTPTENLNLYSQAIKENNMDLCNEITNLEMRQDCLNYKVPVREENMDLKIYTDAIKNNDLSKCDYIMDREIRNDCLNYEFVQVSEITDDQKIYVDAIKRNDVSLCRNILSEDIRSDCVNYFN